jgi:uncharacterized protein YutE (UPF0331/DUF86 family)
MYVVYWQYIIYYTDLITHNGMASLKFIASNAKYNLILIIASCLDVCCVLTVHNILYRFDNTQRDGLSQIYSQSRQI